MVSGEVVRIDKDEVLVDIGYKSEGVIPSTELSIRRSVDPAEEVSLGERVDALVLTKEDQEGRLLLSKKRARFEKAWRKIEAAAESGEPVDGNGDRGRQGRADPRPRRARLPARLAGRHPARPQPRRVQGPDARVQGDRAQPQPQQRRAVAPRRARGGAQGGSRADPRPPPARRGGGGQDLQHRRLRRLRRPRRDRRADPHLRALLEPRQPPLRGALGGRDGQREGARHRPRAPADLARPEADAGGSVAAGARGVPPGRRARGQGHEGGRLRRLRRDHSGRRGAGPHLGARRAPRREPERGRLARRRDLGQDPRDRREPPPDLAQREARRAAEPSPPRPDAAGADRRGGGDAGGSARPRRIRGGLSGAAAPAGGRAGGRRRARRPASRPRRTRAPDRRAVAPPPDINRQQPVASQAGSPLSSA